MLIKTKLLSLVLLFIFNFSFSQKDTVRFARIKLDNGASIKGYLLKDINPENLILKTPSGTAFFIGMDDVRKMKFGRYGIIDRSNSNVIPVDIYRMYDQRIGMYNLFGIGLNFSEYDANWSFTTEFGKRFNDHFAIGLGLNYDRDYFISNMPIYLNGRAYLNNRKVSPFAYAGLGYSLAWKNENSDWMYQFNKVRGGVMGQVGIGYQLNFGGSAVLFNLGYKLQRIYQDYSFNNWYGYTPWSSFAPGHDEPNMNIKEIRVFRRAEFKVSFLF